MDEPASAVGETQQTWVLAMQYSVFPASVFPNGQKTPALVGGKSFGGLAHPASVVDVSGLR